MLPLRDVAIDYTKVGISIAIPSNRMLTVIMFNLIMNATVNVLRRWGEIREPQGTGNSNIPSIDAVCSLGRSPSQALFLHTSLSRRPRLARRERPRCQTRALSVNNAYFRDFHIGKGTILTSSWDKPWLIA